MKQRTRKILSLLLILILLFGSIWFTNPQLHVRLFVFLNKERIESAYEAGLGVPGNLWDVDIHNTWEGDHDMLELILFSHGDTYYGCYYSPDDVPLAFQNTANELTQCGHDAWKWKAEGDNQGKTIRISGHWYYFEASF